MKNCRSRAKVAEALSAIINYLNKSTPADPKNELSHDIAEAANQIPHGSIHEPTHTPIDDLVRILASGIGTANIRKAKYDTLKK